MHLCLHLYALCVAVHLLIGVHAVVLVMGVPVSTRHLTMPPHRLCIGIPQGFVEAPISFPPTYKKADGRPPADMSRPKWVEDEYQTRMVTQWYKGSRHQDRIPSVSPSNPWVFFCFR